LCGYGVVKIAEAAYNTAGAIANQIQEDRAKNRHKNLLEHAAEYVD